MLVDTAADGRRFSAEEREQLRRQGASAAESGIALRALVDLYLSAAWRLWRHLPAVRAAAERPAAAVSAGEALLRALDDAIGELVEGFQLARREVVRREEAARRELFDDLLAGRVEVAGLLERAAGFGLDLAGPHAVAVVRAVLPLGDGMPLPASVERAILGSKGDADALVATREGTLVAIFAAPDEAAIQGVTDQIAAVLGPRGSTDSESDTESDTDTESDADTDTDTDTDSVADPSRGVGIGHWQIGVGRARSGPAGVLSSYEEARDALDVAQRLGLDSPAVAAADLLVYQVLLRDRAAIHDLVTSLLAPLEGARGGAGALLDTLAIYYEEGSNTTATARRLNLSVRAVTYRFERITQLTGRDPAAPAERFALQAAVLGARLIGWPDRADAAPVSQSERNRL